MAICITSFTISEDISFIVKAGQRYPIEFVAAQLMGNTPDWFLLIFNGFLNLVAMISWQY